MKASRLTKETIIDLGTQDRGFPEFGVGDTIQVAQKIKEGDKERIQMFKGDVIAIHNNGVSSTFMVLRIATDSIGVEKIFPFYAPFITEIKVLKRGDVRRAKLYYVRDRVGKAARIKEMVRTKEQKKAKLATAKEEMKVEKPMNTEQPIKSSVLEKEIENHETKTEE
jgi:large subunit ribosomal protein L19